MTSALISVFCCCETKVEKCLDQVTYIKRRQREKKHGFEKKIGKNKLVIQQKLQVMKIFLFLHEQKLLRHSTEDLNNCHDLIREENIHTHGEHLKKKSTYPVDNFLI